MLLGRQVLVLYIPNFLHNLVTKMIDSQRYSGIISILPCEVILGCNLAVSLCLQWYDLVFTTC